ncbi:MAG: hypothetical protein ACYCW6_19725, partial [Candidatus Xenobia bacterium]
MVVSSTLLSLILVATIVLMASACRLIYVLLFIPWMARHPGHKTPYLVCLAMLPTAILLMGASSNLKGFAAAVLMLLARLCLVPGLVAAAALIVYVMAETPGSTLVLVTLGQSLRLGEPAEALGALLFAWLWYVEGFPLLRAFVIRTGWWRLGLCLGLCVTEMAPNNREAPGIVAACLALRRQPDPLAVAYLSTLLPTRASALGPALLSRGMLALARGDEEICRRWLIGIVELTPLHAGFAVRQLAAGWLCAWSASRGQWQKVQAYATSTGQTPELRFWE